MQRAAPEGTFLAAEWTAGGFRVRRFPLAPPGPGEAQVRVLACSVCLTEVHFTDGYYDELDAPARLGHEYCLLITQLARTAGLGRVIVYPNQQLQAASGRDARAVAGPQIAEE